jgi:hypothetical protein
MNTENKTDFGIVYLFLFLIFLHSCNGASSQQVQRIESKIDSLKCVEAQK